MHLDPANPLTPVVIGLQNQVESLRQEIARLNKRVEELGSQVLQRDDALKQAKDVIAKLNTQIYGVRAETSTVVLSHEHQMQIDPAWKLGRETTPPPAPLSEVEVKTVRKPRDPRGLAQRNPDLPIKDIDAPIPSEIQRQVDAGEIELRWSGDYQDSLVTARMAAHILRERQFEVVHKLTGAVTMQLPYADRIVPGGMLADETIHSFVITKYLDSGPFHRQCQAWQREGITIPRQTVNDSFLAWAQVFHPLAQAILGQVLSAPVVHADESWARVQAPETCTRSNIWTLVGGGQVAYRYTADRTHDRATEIIPATFRNRLVVDAWQGWLLLTWLTLALCNAHARRPFAAVLKRERGNRDAASIVTLYAEVYRLEHLAEEGPPEGLLDRRRRIRHEQTRLVMERIRSEAKRIAQAYPTSHELAVGARYIDNHYVGLTQFLDDPRLPPDNNAAENALRINALMRKNSLFIGNDEAGKHTADALTVLHSCRLARISPMDYLQQVTPALLRVRQGRKVDLSGLTPLAIARGQVVAGTA